MYYNYGYGSSGLFDEIFSSGVAFIVCALLALGGGIFLFVWFLSKKNENKFTGFVKMLYDFLSFKKMLAEGLLRVTYLITTCFIILFSLYTLFFTEGGSIGAKFLAAVIAIVVGNVIIRIIYEFLLIILIICRNTTEINKKLNKNISDE